MRTVVTLLGLAGATLYGSYSYFAPGAGRQQSLAEVTQIVAGAARSSPATTSTETANDVARASRTFSPQQPLLAPAGPVVMSGRPAEPPRASIVASRRSDPFDAVPVVRTPQSTEAPRADPSARGAETVAGSLAAPRAAAARPTSEEARVALVRDLQKELRRVGCYEGEVTGSWGSGTKRAMGEFTSRVNASLPVDAPDYVLLALVRGHAGQVCGAACAGGGRPTADGRCPAKEHILQAGRTLTAAAGGDTRGQPAQRPVLDDKGLESRAAAMASQLATATMPSRTSRLTETTAFPARQSGQSAPARAQVPVRTAAGDVKTASVSAPAATPSSPATALPGRMSVGALGGPAEQPQDTGGRAAAFAHPRPDPAAMPAAGPAETAPPYQYQELPGTGTAAPRPQAKRSARSAASPRYSYYDRPYYAYDRPPPPPSYGRQRSSGSLKNAANVRDFFFGAGRSSF